MFILCMTTCRDIINIGSVGGLAGDGGGGFGDHCVAGISSTPQPRKKCGYLLLCAEWGSPSAHLLCVYLFSDNHTYFICSFGRCFYIAFICISMSENKKQVPPKDVYGLASIDYVQ